jgi:hypothetical protein
MMGVWSEPNNQSGISDVGGVRVCSGPAGECICCAAGLEAYGWVNEQWRWVVIKDLCIWVSLVALLFLALIFDFELKRIQATLGASVTVTNVVTIGRYVIEVTNATPVTHEWRVTVPDTHPDTGGCFLTNYGVPYIYTNLWATNWSRLTTNNVWHRDGSDSAGGSQYVPNPYTLNIIPTNR